MEENNEEQKEEKDEELVEKGEGKEEKESEEVEEPREEKSEEEIEEPKRGKEPKKEGSKIPAMLMLGVLIGAIVGALAGLAVQAMLPGELDDTPINVEDDKVGIRTTTPDTELDVDGVITAEGGNSDEWNTAFDDALKWDGGSAGLDPAAGRSSLGLGSLSTEETIDDDDWDGTELSITHGGTGASSASDARTNLGLVAGGTGDIWVDASGDTMTGTLNLPVNGLVAGTDQLVLSGGNVGIGTATPATELDVNGVITANGGDSDEWNTAFEDRFKWDGGSEGLDPVVGRSSLGLGSLATLSTINDSNWAGTELSIVHGGTGASTEADARANLGLIAGGAGDIWVEKSGDTMTGTLNLPADGLVAGTSQLVLSGGNMGIGMVSPTERLDVEGNIHASGAFIAGSWTSYANGSIGLSPGINLTIADGVLFIDTLNKRTGIGTSTPTRELDVNGSIIARGNILATGEVHVNSNNYGVIHWGATGKYGQASSFDFNPGISGFVLEYGVGESAGIYFDEDTAVIWSPGDADILRVYDEDDFIGGPKMVLDWYGNLGIGVTAPSERLDVDGDIRLGGTNIKDAGGTPRISIEDNGRLDLMEDGGSASLSIDTIGRVGIGTMSPLNELHVEGQARVTDSIVVGPSATRFAMEQVSLTADGTLFTHPGAGVTLTWASATRVLTFNNNAGAFWDVSMMANDETTIAGNGTGQFAVDDISGGGGTLSLDGDQAGGISHGWYVNAADEGTGPGFTFMGTGYGNYIQGIVIYWW